MLFYIQGRVVQKAISANSGLKFNRLFILACSAWQLKVAPCSFLKSGKHMVRPKISYIGILLEEWN